MQQPLYNDTLITRRQNVNDIISALIDIDSENRQYDEDIRRDFQKWERQHQRAGSLQTKIYHYVNDRLKYIQEPLSNQTVKTIPRLINDAYGDCKHFSLLAAAACRANGARYKFRFASYKGNEPTHVYIICNGQPLDSVANSPHYEKVYNKAYDINPKKTNIMALSKLTGTAQINGTFATIAAAPARLAFLLLIKLNVFQLRAKLKRANAANGAKVKTWWEKFGGDYSKLINQMQSTEGEKEEEITVFTQFSPESGYYYADTETWKEGMPIPEPNTNAWKMYQQWLATQKAPDTDIKAGGGKMGALPAAAAAALVAATPIILSVTKLIKEILPNEKTDAIDKAGSEAAKQFINPATGAPYPIDQNTGMPITGKTPDTSTGSGDMSKYILPIAAGAAILLLMKK